MNIDSSSELLSCDIVWNVYYHKCAIWTTYQQEISSDRVIDRIHGPTLSHMLTKFALSYLPNPSISSRVRMDRERQPIDNHHTVPFLYRSTSDKLSHSSKANILEWRSNETSKDILQSSMSLPLSPSVFTHICERFNVGLLTVLWKIAINRFGMITQAYAIAKNLKCRVLPKKTKMLFIFIIQYSECQPLPETQPWSNTLLSLLSLILSFMQGKIVYII